MAFKLAASITLKALGITCVGVTSSSAQIPQIPPTTQSIDQQKILFSPDKPPKAGVGWEITTTFTKAEIALAHYLVDIGAKEYVAWWCPHCHEQKLLFGKEAYQIINDSIKVECDRRSLNAHPDWCETANILGFPLGSSMAISIVAYKISRI